MTVVPVYNVTLVPGSTAYLQTELYKRATGHSPAPDEKVTLIVTKEPQTRQELTAESFYPIGLNGVITELHPEGFIAVKTGERVNLEEITVANGEIELFVSRRPDIEDLDKAANRRRLDAMRGEMKEIAKNFRWGRGADVFIDSGTLWARLPP